MRPEDTREFVRLAGLAPSAEQHCQHRFLELARQIANRLAKDLRLPAGSFQARVGADVVTIQAEHLRVELRQGGRGITFQACANRKDRTGCANWLSANSLERDYEGALRMFRGSIELAETLRAAA